MTASQTWNGSTTGARYIRILHYTSAGVLVGTYSSPATATSTGDQFGRGAVPMAYIDAALNDYLTAEVWQSSGGPLNFGIGTVSTLPTPTFTVTRLK